jgi:hypothetical protein
VCVCVCVSVCDLETSKHIGLGLLGSVAPQKKEKKKEKKFGEIVNLPEFLL